MSNAGSSPTAGSKRNVEIDDLYRFRLLSEPQLSPDGRLIAYVQTRLRKKKNDYAANIWLAASDGSSEPRRFTGSDARDGSPRWSPKGDELAFISTRSGKPQIWIIRLDGGEARRLTNMKRGVGDFAWSPDGRWIAFTYAVDNDEDKRRAAESAKSGTTVDSENRPLSGVTLPDLAGPVRGAGEWEEDEEPETEAEDKGDHAKVITRLHYKADGQGLLMRRKHLFIVATRGGNPRQLTEGDWDVAQPVWSPDGRFVAFLSNQEPDADYHDIADIFTLAISSTGQAGEMRRVTNHDSAIMGMDWLPGGQGFAAFAHTRIDEGAVATNPEVWAISPEGEKRNLTEGFDRPAGAWISSDLRSGAGEFKPRISRDGATIFFRVTTEGSVHIFSVPVDGGEVSRVLGGEREILNFSLGEQTIAFIATTPDVPNDLYVADVDGAHERRLTQVNADVLGAVRLGETRSFWVDNKGTRVQSWVVLPPGYREGEKYPLVLQIHGGPHMAYGNVYFHEFQAMAAKGTVVLYTNPRGSQGYGQEFSDAILNDWGGVDYDDLMACVDNVIGQGYVDENRMGVAGGSYGGYMTAWIIGHTDRFKAAVASRLVSNLYSAWGSGDFTWMLWNWEMQGMPQERTRLYLERSPITYAPNIHTPLLLTHAEDDLRTSIEQGEQMYMALKVLKRDVKMVRFPAGGHDVSRSGKPSLRVQRMQHIVEWFEKYLSVTSGE